MNVSDDNNAHIADPGLGNQTSLILPRWRPTVGYFGDSSETICKAFERFVQGYGMLSGSSVVDQANAAQAPDDDLLGNPRGGQPDIGAVESP